MKRWIHAATDDPKRVESSEEPKKLKRTLESGHSYEGDITFDTVEEYRRWHEEDELYED